MFYYYKILKYNRNMYYKYICTIIYIFIVEFIWIYLINSDNYALLTKNVQKNKLELNIKYSIITYIFVLGSIFIIAIPFTVSKLDKKEKKYISILKSLIYGGLIGLYIYGIYNFTSLSIYKNYSLKIGIIDTLWGAFLYATSVTLYLFI